MINNKINITVWNSCSDSASVFFSKSRIYFICLLLFQSIKVMSCTPTGPNIIVNGNFSQGNYGFTTAYIYTNVQNGLYSNNYYAVGSDILYYHSGAAGHMYDHTVGNASGSYLMCNGASSANTIVWSQTVAVTPNTDYVFSMWDANWSSLTTGNFAVFKILVNGVSIGADTCVHPNFIWKQVLKTWNSQSNTSATISIVDLELNGYGNDFAIDDIGFQSCGLPPAARLTCSDTAFCEGYSCVNFYDLSLNNPAGWKWYFPDAFPDTSTLPNPDNVCYTHAGSYSVTLITNNSAGADTLTLNNYITVYPEPPAPVISQINDTLLQCRSDSAYASYQWYDDSTLVPGATDTLLSIHHSGNYNVQVSTAKGCKIAVGINVILTGGKNLSEPWGVIIFPNPAAEFLTIQMPLLHADEAARVTITNLLGEIILEGKGKLSGKANINVEALPAGIYFLQIKSKYGEALARFVKQ
jgi:PKD repeat protein